MCTSGAFTIATPPRTSVGDGDRSGVGAHDAVRQHVVGEVDPLRWAGRAAGQHPHRDTGSVGIAAFAGSATCGSASKSPISISPSIRMPARRRFVRSSESPMITGSSSAAMSACGAVVTAGRVDHDDGPAGQQHPEERGDVCGPVAQQDPDLPAVVAPAWRSDGRACRAARYENHCPSYSIAASSGARSSTAAIRLRNG